MSADLRRDQPLGFQLGFGPTRMSLGDILGLSRLKHNDFEADFAVSGWTPRPSEVGAMVGCASGTPLVLDESPERAAFRVPSRLYDRNDSYLGDGVQEVVALADGTVFFGLGLRVIRRAGLRALRTAGWRLNLGRGCRSVETAAGGRLKRGPRGFEEAGDWVILQRGKRFVGVFWGGDAQIWLEKLGGEGPWAPVGDGSRPPFYRGWETLLRQWGAPRGWPARAGARLALDDRGLIIAWHAGERLPLDPVNHFSAAAAVVAGGSVREVRRKLEALAAPLPPAASEGAAPVGFDRLEGAYRFRRTAGVCRLTFPTDPLGRLAHVRVDGPPAAALACSVNGAPARPQLVSLGRTDDPNAPHDGRPDGGARPVLAADQRPAERALLPVRLSPDRATTVELAVREGLSLSYLAQDDRRELLLFSSRDGDAPAPCGRLSLHDLRFRALRPPGAERPAAACLPLYWYMMNAPSQWQSANVLESWEFAENGPERVRLRFASRNPGGEVRSEFDLAVTAPAAGALLFDVAARLDVLAAHAVPHLQFCNLFPENSRFPDDWTHDESMLAMSGDIRVADNRTEARRFARVELSAPFFVAQYGTQGGLALLATGFRPARTPLVWELCRCWLDNHFYAVFPDGGPAVGGRFEARYQVLVWSGGPADRTGVERMARAALAAGKLGA